MAKFRLISGRHNQDGRNYVKGDIVESLVDLTKVFRHKFEQVTDFTPAPPVSGPKRPLPPPPDANQNPPMGEDALPEVEASPQTQEVKEPVQPAGKEVTTNFPKAVDEDFRIFKKGTGYWVYDAEDVTTPLNKVPLGKVAVNTFILQTLEVAK